MDSPMLMATMEEDKDMISSLKRKESDLDKDMISSSKIKESEEEESKFDVGDLQTNLKKKKKNLEKKEEEEEEDDLFPIPDECLSFMPEEARDEFRRMIRRDMALRNPQEEEQEEEEFDYKTWMLPVTYVWEDCEDFKQKGMTTQGCTNYGA